MMAEPVRALIAPDKFKGTFSAHEVAELVAAGFGEGADTCPLADGGEGTASLLVDVEGGEWISARAPDALGREVDCRYALLGDGTAVVEVAAASGLWRLNPDELDPIRADSAGTGVLAADAIERGAERLLIGCGGSASSDGGVGALAHFDPKRIPTTCLCDTSTSFVDAAARFAPQKGAGPGQVIELAERLTALLAELPHDPSRLPFTGAAGGLSGGLWAHGARLVPGAREILHRVGFDRRLAAAELVITGEGCLDASSWTGKVVGEVCERCRRAGVPVHVVSGALGDLPPARLEALASHRRAADSAELRAAGAAVGGSG